MDNLDIRLQMEGIICEREAMIAENKLREMQGERLAYGESYFFSLSERLAKLWELIGRCL